MGKKKKKKYKKMKEDFRVYDNFASYVDKTLPSKWEKIEEDIDFMIRETEKADRKYKKMKAKAKKGKIKVSLKDYRKSHPIKVRESILEFFKSSDFLEIVTFILTNGATIAKVIGRMIASLIALILSVKPIRRSIPASMLDKMSWLYEKGMGNI